MSCESPDSAPSPRELSDPVVMRALSHPVRLALIEALTFYGPLTATQAGERLDESPTTCSFHLRQLAKYGFVEEAGGGRGRARPWRMTAPGFAISDVPEGADAEVAAGTLLEAALKRQLARHAHARRTQSAYPEEWRRTISQNETVWWVTPEEAEQLWTDLRDLVRRYRDRLDPDNRPDGTRPVEFVALTHPLEPPRPRDDDAPGPTT